MRHRPHPRGGERALPLRRHRRLLIALLAGSCHSESTTAGDCVGVVVDEVFASSDTVRLDDACGIVDWVELYNPTGRALDLTGFSLSTNPDDFTGEPLSGPGAHLPPGGRLVVVASPNAITSCERLVTGIDLNRDSNGVALVSPTGRVCQEVRYPDQHSDWSWGRLTDGGERCARLAPTPGRSNEGAPRLSGRDFACEPEDGFGPWDRRVPALAAASATCADDGTVEVSVRTDHGWLENPGYAHLATADGAVREDVLLHTVEATDDERCDLLVGRSTVDCARLPDLKVMVRMPFESGCAGCGVTPGDAAWFQEHELDDRAVVNEFIGCPDGDDAFDVADCTLEVTVGDDVGTCR